MESAGALFIFILVIIWQFYRHYRGQVLVEKWAKEKGYVVTYCKRISLLDKAYGNKVRFRIEYTKPDSSTVRGIINLGTYFMGLLEPEVEFEYSILE